MSLYDKFRHSDHSAEKLVARRQRLAELLVAAADRVAPETADTLECAAKVLMFDGLRIRRLRSGLLVVAAAYRDGDGDQARAWLDRRDIFHEDLEDDVRALALVAKTALRKR